MKLIYTLILISGLLFIGLLLANDFNLASVSISNYFVNAILLVIAGCIALAITRYLLSQKRKSTFKDVMTIRQYYQYRNAR